MQHRFVEEPFARSVQTLERWAHIYGKESALAVSGSLSRFANYRDWLL